MGEPGTTGEVLLTACGAGAPAPGVVDRVVRHLAREVQVGGYDAQDEVADELATLRGRVGPLLGLERGDVSLTGSGNSAAAALSIAWATSRARLDGLIVTDPREFGANLATLDRLADSAGTTVHRLGLRADGHLDIDELGELVTTGRVALVWLSMAHAHAGWTNPVDRLAPALGRRPEHTWLVLDVCQSMGQLDDNLGPLDPDAALGTSRKWLRGPRGAGLTWLHPRRVEQLSPWPRASAPPSGVFERHEGPIAGWTGLGVALAHLDRRRPKQVHAEVSERARLLRSTLAEVANWRCIDDPTTPSAIVSYAPLGPIESHQANVSEARRALADVGIRVTEAHAHHAPGAFAALGVDVALRCGPHAEEPLDRLEAAAGVIAEVMAAPD